MQTATPRAVCRACRGTGQVKRAGQPVKCQACRGTGRAGGYQTKH